MTNKPKTFLNIGCGRKHLPGFINMDITRPYDRKLDARKGLPFLDGSVDGIYSEHFFEHLTQAEGLRFLRECRRVLKHGGRIRIAMPDLDELVQRYSSENWRGDGDMFRLGFDWVVNRCEMMNIAMREWGHRHLYNEEELVRVTNLAGFRARNRTAHGESELVEFRGLETRPGSKLVMEFEPRREVAPESRPLVSILIPAYKPEFFQATLASALNQSYPNLEIIVSDDSPDDRIGEMVRVNSSSVIRYVRNVPPNGPMGNYICLIDLAQGEYLKFLNDDDVLRPDCVEKMAKALAVPSVSLATSYHELIDEHGSRLADQVVNAPLFAQDTLIEGTSFAERMLKFCINYVGEPSCVMFRKDDVTWVQPHPFTFGGYGRDKSGVADVGIALNLLSQGNAAYLAQPLSQIRLSPLQWSNTSDAREWSLTTWRHFLWHGARLGLFKSRSLGWKLKCRPLWESHASWRPVTKLNLRALILQARWITTLLKDKWRGQAG